MTDSEVEPDVDDERDDAASADAGDTETVTLEQLAEQVQDLSRVIARQAQTLDRLVDADRTREKRAAAGADLPLLVDLFALYTDAVSCAQGAGDADRDAFTALADSLARVISGRSGTLVIPAVGAPFDARTMEAVDIVDTDDAEADRTVAQLLRPGLQVGDRSVRAAAVVVHRVSDS